MPSYKAAFGSYLKTEDLQGRPARVVIESVGLEEVKGEDGKEMKLIARFHGKDKGLILNRTNCELLEQITGLDDYDAWVGATVVLYPTTTRFGNKTVPCLRIKQMAAAPAATAPSVAPQAPRPVAAVARPAPVREPGEDDGPLTADDVGF